MKKILSGVMLVVVASACFAQETGQSTQTTQPTPSTEVRLKPGLEKTTVILNPTTKTTLIPATTGIIVDQYYSPYTGSSLNTSLFQCYKTLDDTYLYDSAGKINFLWGVGRLGKLYAEGFLFRYLTVDQHEIFGHGYRGREFGMTNIHYKVGVNSGWAAFDPIQYDALSLPESTALVAGGVEATTILSQQIRKNWFLSNQIDRRDARFYLYTALDQPSYILLSTSNATSGNDIVAYVNNINEWYGNQVISVSSLHNKAWWDLLDPTIYYSIYSIGTYIFESSAYTNMYTFNIKGYKYLPTPRLILSPWGPEFQIQNHIVTPTQQLLQINLRYGKTSFIKSYGVDVLMDNIYTYRDFVFGNKLYIWNQPQFLKQNTAVGIKNSFGVADYLSVEHKIYKDVSGYGEFGYKTAGFIQGNPLRNSWVWRLGIIVRP